VVVGMRSFGFAVAAVVGLGATLATPLGARELHGLGTIVSRLSEPGALVLWGTVLAGLAYVLNRRF
jgi:hypothetical protein